MHPFLRSPRHILLMGLFWSPIAFGVIFLQHSLSGSSLAEAAILVGPLMLIELFICLSIWFPCKAISIEQNRFLPVVVRHALAASAMVLLWLSLGLIYSRILNDLGSPPPDWIEAYHRSLPLLAVIGLFLYLTFTLIYYMVLALEKGRKAEQQALENRLTASAAELSSLKTAIHPHFLFNSLTSLSALTRKSPEQAQKMSLQLADFLRYSLSYGKQDWVRVRDEVTHIQDYLEIEKIRLGDRLNIDLSVDPDSEQERLPPFSLLPLVENAVKHGFQSSLGSGTLCIRIQKKYQALQIEVANPFDPSEAPSRHTHEGHGLRGLHKRLKNVYSGEADLMISKEAGTFQVTLRLPRIEPPGASPPGEAPPASTHRTQGDTHG